MQANSDTWDESEWGMPAAAERRLALAAVCGLGKDGDPVSAADVDRVGRWAKSLMRDAAIVDLMFAGDVLPVGFEGDEVLFGPTKQILTEEQLDAFQLQLRKLEVMEKERTECEPDDTRAEWKKIKKQQEEDNKYEYEDAYEELPSND